MAPAKDELASTTVCREASFADGLHLMQKRYSAGLRMGRHEHSEWRFCLTLKGSYTESWRRSSRTRRSWQLSLHPAGEAHSCEFHTSASCFHVEFTRQWRERLVGDAGIALEPQEFLSGRVPMLATHLYREFGHGDPVSSLIVEGLACELIGWMARESCDEACGPTWVYQARDLLHDRFNENLRLTDIAATLNVHPVHLARRFKRQFGSSVGEYVRQLRVDFTQQQLLTGAELADIAVQAGFADQSHLTRVFKRLTGRTPGQFRVRR